MSDMETCGNCGHRIGKLEEAHFWKDHVVCSACKELLARQAKPKSGVGQTGSASASNSKAGVKLSSSSSASASGAVIKLVPTPAEPDKIHFKDDDDVFSTPPDIDVPVAPSASHASHASRAHRSAHVAPTTYPCSQCGAVLRADEVTRDGDQVLCQSCAMFAASGDYADAGAPAGAVRRDSGGGGAAMPPWLPLAIAGAVLVVVIIVSAMFLIHGNEDEDDQQSLATQPPVKKAVLPTPATPAVPAAPAAPKDDTNNEAETHKLLDAMLAASELEASGKREEALKNYLDIANTLSAKPSKSEAQSKTLARAQAAVTRLSAALASSTASPSVGSAPKPDSIFADPTPGKKPGTPSAAGNGFDDTDDGNVKSNKQDEPAEEEIAGVAPKSKPELAAPDASPSSPSAPGATTKATAKGIDGLIERGKEALANSDYPAALKAFKDALDFDKKNAHALHGLGLTQYYQNDQSKAVETMEKAVVAGANRAIIFNLAVIHLKANPMRAAKYVRDYLARPGVPLDEPLQNMLGAALDAAGATDAKNGQTFADLRNFYFQYDRQLAAARKDGLKRWGINWIPGAQADQKWQTSQSRVQEADRAEKDATKANMRTKKENEKLQDLYRSFGLHAEREYKTAKARIKEAGMAEIEANKRREAARAALSQTEMPEFPKYVNFIPIDCLKVEQHPKM